MTSFVAIYRGQTIAEAKLVAVSADPSLVAEVSSRMLHDRGAESRDPVIARVDRGKNDALRIIKQEATET